MDYIIALIFVAIEVVLIGIYLNKQKIFTEVCLEEETDKDKGTETNTETETETNTETDKDKETETNTNTETDKDKDKETETNTNTETDNEDKDKNENINENEDKKVYKPLINLSTKTHFYIVMGIILVTLLGCSLLLVNGVSNIVNLIKLIVLMGITSAAAVVDLKKTIIPNFLIIIGLIVRVAIYVIELLFFNSIFVPQLISDLIGFGIGFGILFIASVVSKGALGFGDVKLFGLIGLMSGAICTYSTLIFSLLSSTVISAILMITRKKNRKDSIPFGPFIFIGYVLSIILTSY